MLVRVDETTVSYLKSHCSTLISVASDGVGLWQAEHCRPQMRIRGLVLGYSAA